MTRTVIALVALCAAPVLAQTQTYPPPPPAQTAPQNPPPPQSPPPAAQPQGTTAASGATTNGGAAPSQPTAAPNSSSTQVVVTAPNGQPAPSSTTTNNTTQPAPAPTYVPAPASSSSYSSSDLAVESHPPRSPLVTVFTDAAWGGLAGAVVGTGVSLIDQGRFFFRDLMVGTGAGVLVGAAVGGYEAYMDDQSSRHRYAEVDRAANPLVRGDARPGMGASFSLVRAKF